MVPVIQKLLCHIGEMENPLVSISGGWMSQQFQSGAEGMEDYWRAAGIQLMLEVQIRWL